MEFGEPRSILHVCVHGRPTAILAVASNADFLLQYLPDAKDDISPVLPKRKPPYRFTHLPIVFACLLPGEGRYMQVAKLLGLDAQDTLAHLRHSLNSENIGHLTVIPSVETLAVSIGGFSLDGLSAMAPGPAVMTAGSLEVMHDIEIQRALPQELLKKGGCTGVGGRFAKGFLRTASAEYLIKHYNDLPGAKGAELARMEAASILAANRCGVPAAEALAFGTLLCSLRFDRPGAVKMSHARELTQDQGLYDGSNERILELVVEFAQGAEVDFAKQVIYAWVLGDSGKHQENIAFLEKDGRRWLSPLYDSLPTRFVSADANEAGLSIGGKNSAITGSDIFGFADLAGLGEADTARFIVDAVQAVRDVVLPACPEGIFALLSTHLDGVKTLVN